MTYLKRSSQIIRFIVKRCDFTTRSNTWYLEFCWKSSKQMHFHDSSANHILFAALRPVLSTLLSIIMSSAPQKNWQKNQDTRSRSCHFSTERPVWIAKNRLQLGCCGGGQEIWTNGTCLIPKKGEFVENTDVVSKKMPCWVLLPRMFSTFYANPRNQKSDSHDLFQKSSFFRVMIKKKSPPSRFLTIHSNHKSKGPSEGNSWDILDLYMPPGMDFQKWMKYCW